MSVGRKIRPFNDYDLGSVISTKQNELHEKIDSFSNEIIMANDIELLAENLYQEFFIDPVAIGEEVCRDRDDVAIVACALGGKAKVICSGDGDLLALNGFHGLEIMNPSDFCQRMGF